MATFQYNALTSAGRLMRGTIEAGSREEAGQTLSQMDLDVNSIERAKPEMPKTAIGRNEFMLFNQQLESITKAGLPLERALRELSNDIASRPMRRLITSIANDLEAGANIEQAFRKRQKHFPPLYGKILKAGVETGRLSEMLASLNRHLEVANRTRRIVFEALTYPAIVLVMVALVMTLLFVFVIPQFDNILRDMLEGQPLPYLTQTVLAIADKVVTFWVTVGVFAAGLVAAYVVLSSYPAGRRLKESIYLRVPVWGGLYHSSTLSRMAEAMAAMVAAGAALPTCLRLGATSTGSEKMILESDIVAGQIEAGANIMEAGQFCRLIPRLFLCSMQLGAQRNELQDNLYSLGEMYAGQTRCSQGRLQALFLPIMIIVLGVIVAMIILAIFLPMIQVVTGLSGG